MLKIDLFLSSARDEQGERLVKAVVSSDADEQLDGEGDAEKIREWLTSPDGHVLVWNGPADVRWLQ